MTRSSVKSQIDVFDLRLVFDFGYYFFVTFVSGRMADGNETESVNFPVSDLRYFADKLRRSGLFKVDEITSSPAPGYPSAVQFNTDHTPVRDYLRESLGVTYTRLPSAREPEWRPPVPPKPKENVLLQSPILANLSGRSEYVHHRVPELPCFSGEEKGIANLFEIWRYDVHCLIDENIYPMHVIREAIRKSLKGTARGVLLHLGEFASVMDIISELEGIYGNVQSEENLKEQFYSEHQREGESVADFSLRLERLLSRVPESLDRPTRNRMLRSRLWSGLRDLELKNVSRYLFEKVEDYNTLRRELRVIEEDLRLSRQSLSQVIKPTQKQGMASDAKRVVRDEQRPEISEAKQFVTSVESRLLKQMETMTLQMSRMESKLMELDKEVKDLKKGQAERYEKRSNWQNKGKENPNKESSSDGGAKKSNLNLNRPPSQGR